MHDEVKFLANLWLSTRALTSIERAWSRCFVMVYAFQHFQVSHKATFEIVGGLLTCLVLGIYTHNWMRRWALTHPWFITTFSAVTETLIKLWLLVDPFIAYVAMTGYDAFCASMWRIQEAERRAAAFENACDRAWFDVAMERTRYLSAAGGAGLALVWQPTIEVVVGLSAFFGAIAYYASAYRIHVTDKWCATHRIVYPSFR